MTNEELDAKRQAYCDTELSKVVNQWLKARDRASALREKLRAAEGRHAELRLKMISVESEHPEQVALQKEIYAEHDARREAALAQYLAEKAAGERAAAPATTQSLP